jgi:hypothetical protein
MWQPEDTAMLSFELIESLVMIAVIVGFVVAQAVYLARKEDQETRRETGRIRAA